MNMETTLHNHIKLGTEEKPLIQNIKFKELLDSVISKNKNESIIEKYTLTQFQQDLISYYERSNF